MVLSRLDRNLKRNVSIEMFGSVLKSTVDLDTLDTPLIRTVQGGADPEGSWWLLTEEAQSRSLREHVEQHGPLPASEAYAIGVSVAAALKHLDERGLVHGFLTPDCVSVSEDRLDVAVGWYGFSSLLIAYARTGSWGSELYLAPRRLRIGKQPDIRDDVYSLGRLLLFSLTGEPLVTGRSSAVSRRLHPGKIKALGLDPDLSRLIARCLRRWAWTRPNPSRLLRRIEKLGQAESRLTASCQEYIGSFTPAPTKKPDSPDDTTPPREVKWHVGKGAAAPRTEQAPPLHRTSPARPLSVYPKTENLPVSATSLLAKLDAGASTPNVPNSARLFPLSPAMGIPGFTTGFEQRHRWRRLPGSSTKKVKIKTRTADVPAVAKPWVFATNGMVDAPVTVHGTDVFVGSTDGCLYALKLRSGEPKWDYATGAAIISAPLALGGAVLVVSTDGLVHAVRAKDGRPLWRVEVGEVGLSDPVSVADGIHFIALGGEIVSLWPRTKSTTRLLLGDAAGSSITAADAELFVGTLHGVHAIAAEDQRLVPKWRYAQTDASGCTPAITEDSVFIGGTGRDGENTLHSIDRFSGTGIWRVPTDGLVLSRPAPGSNRLYTGDDEGSLTAFEMATGAVKWRVRHSAPIFASPALWHDRIHIAGRDKHLRSYSAKTGAEIWAVAAAGWINRSAPVIAGGLILVGSADGHVHAVSLGGDGIPITPQQVDIRLTL